MGIRALLLSAGFGSGHLQAARAVADALENLDPTALVDAKNLNNRLLGLTAAGYLAMLRLVPGLYRELYRSPVGDQTRFIIRTALNRAVTSEIVRVRPTAVVATHPFPGGTAAHLRRTGRLNAPVFMVLTDFSPHPLWIHSGVDHYFVASASAAQRMIILGVDAKRISVSGLPVRQGYANPMARARVDGIRRVLLMGPMLLLPPLPGHEEENAAHLINTGAALLTDPFELHQTISTLLWGTGDRLSLLRESARLTGRPSSARTIANQIIMLSTPDHNEIATG